MEIKNQRHKIRHTQRPPTQLVLQIAPANLKCMLLQPYIKTNDHLRFCYLYIFVVTIIQKLYENNKRRNVQLPKTDFPTTKIKCQLPVFCTKSAFFTVWCRAQKTVVYQKRQRRNYDLVDVKPARFFGTNFGKSIIVRKFKTFL